MTRWYSSTAKTVPERRLHPSSNHHYRTLRRLTRWSQHGASTASIEGVVMWRE